MSLPPLNIDSADKLRLLRRLDQYRRWESLDDQRQCIQCGEIITGREIDVVGGTRELGPLRLQCPTENCRAIPMDWIIPNTALAAAPERQAVALPNELFPARGANERKFATRWFRNLLRQRA